MSEPLLGKTVLVNLAMHQGVWEVIETNDGPSVKVERRGDCATRWVDKNFVDILKNHEHEN